MGVENRLVPTGPPRFFESCGRKLPASDCPTALTAWPCSKGCTALAAWLHSTRLQTAHSGGGLDLLAKADCKNFSIVIIRLVKKPPSKNLKNRPLCYILYKNTAL